MTEAAVDSRLRALLARIFADGALDVSEREELQTLWRQAKLTLPVVRATFDDFLRAELGHALADGVVDEGEKDKLRFIVRALKIPPAKVPEEIKRAVE
jgi:hypothetical protein